MYIMSHDVIVYIDVFDLVISGRVVRDVKCCLTVSEERNRTNC